MDKLIMAQNDLFSKMGMGSSNNSSTFVSEGLKHKLVKGAVTGVILGAATSVLYGGGSIPVFGVDLPGAIPIALTGATASIVTDYAHDMIYPHLNNAEKKLADIGSIGAGAAISAGAGALVFKTIGIPDANLPMVAGLCAGSYIAADYVDARILSDRNGKLIF